jgi:hypothetical protein
VPQLPYSLAHKPELYLHLTLVWIIFTLVRNCRVVSEFGIGAIALADMRTMLDEFQIEEPDVRIYYIQLLMALDTVWMQQIVKTRK